MIFSFFQAINKIVTISPPSAAGLVSGCMCCLKVQITGWSQKIPNICSDLTNITSVLDHGNCDELVVNHKYCSLLFLNPLEQKRIREGKWQSKVRAGHSHGSEMSRARMGGWICKGQSGKQQRVGCCKKKPFAKTKAGDGGRGWFLFSAPTPRTFRPQLICNQGGSAQCNQCGKNVWVEQCCARPYVCSSSAC